MIKKIITFVFILLFCFNAFAITGVPEYIKNYEEFRDWVTNNFVYKYSFKNYIQCPEETVRLKTGVCGDFAVLYSAFVSELLLDNDIIIIEFNGLKQLHAVCVWRDNQANYIVSDNKRLIYTGKKTIQEAMKYMYWDIKRLYKLSRKEDYYKHRPYPQPPIFYTPIKIK